jgi:GntR family phosphonate transport system transcriptional regulator
MARLPDADEARLLQQPKNRPVLVTESVNVDANGKPIEYGVARFAADRVQIVFQS